MDNQYNNLDENVFCICGHKNIDHFCSQSMHKFEDHICNVTDRVFCGQDNVDDPSWSCPCKHFKMDNIKYLEMKHDRNSH